MTNRIYSVAELNALRNTIEHKWLYGSYSFSGNGGASRSYYESEKITAVEDMVRTHMLAGHTTEDLYASEQSSSKSGVVDGGS